MISIVCPFFNEEAIIEASMKLMLENLETLDDDWELIVVNDGSSDNSASLVQAIADERKDSKLKVVGYPQNKGRGYAIKHGIAQAVGEYVVTTEIDSSWGDRIVHNILAKLNASPDLDMVIASPNLGGGGYKNVPLKRILISRVGNKVLQIGQGASITMYTGMTRGYKREKFLTLTIDENEKEFHLEVAKKAMAFNFKIAEIPAILEWKEDKLSKVGAPKRKSSSKIMKLVGTHIQFSLFAAPFRYLFPISGVFFLLSIGFLLWAVTNLFNELPSIYLLMISGILFVASVILMSIGILAFQNRQLEIELWRTRSDLAKLLNIKPNQ